MNTMQNLSKAAREEYERLTRKLTEIVNTDRERDPKLTEEEKSEIAVIQETINRLQHVVENINIRILEREKRREVLERDSVQMIIEGEDVDALVSERAMINPVIQLLSDVYREAATQGSMSEMRIKKIKEQARARELSQERK